MSNEYNTPKIILSHLFSTGLARTETEIITAGMASATDAVNKATGLLSTFEPFRSPSTFSGTYNSK